MRILAVDPGISGALALLEDGDLMRLEPMPTISVTVAGKVKRRVCAIKLATMIRDMNADTIAIEDVGPRPGQGTVSIWSFARSAVLPEGIAAALGTPLHLIRPQAWRAAVGLPGGLSKASGKTASRHLAATLFPDFAKRFGRVKDDGLAEAVLIGVAVSRAILPPPGSCPTHRSRGMRD